MREIKFRANNINTSVVIEIVDKILAIDNKDNRVNEYYFQLINLYN